MTARSSLLVAAVAAAAGCNGLLGIEELHLSDAGAAPDALVAPPNTVVGFSRITHSSSAGVEVLAEDLSEYVIQALIPDAGEPSGFRTSDGVGTADGYFTIEDVPDGEAYYLKILTPAALGSRFAVTDQHVIDLGFVVGGRADVEPVAPATNLDFDLTLTRPWQLGDFMVASVFNTSSEYWGMNYAVVMPPLPGAPTFDMTFDWTNSYASTLSGRGALIDGTKGDELRVTHVHTAPELDTGNRLQAVDHTVAVFTTDALTIDEGTTTAVTGAFTPITEDGTLRVIFNRGSYDTTYDDSTTQLSGASVGILVNHNAGGYGLTTGTNVFNIAFQDWSRSTTPTSTIDVAYADPYPEEWQRVMAIGYTRLRWLRLPGTTSMAQAFAGHTRFMEPISPVPSTPDIQPPAAIMIEGAGAYAGGRLMFDGTAPVTASWGAVSTASYFEIRVSRVYAEGTRTRRVTVSTLTTQDTSIEIPAEVFAGGQFFTFSVAAVRAGSGYGQGRVRARAFPWSSATSVSGLFRLSALCGNGATDSGEQCDPGATETAACDIDCSLPLCGDGLRNAAAGEACDTIEGSFACDGDCTLPVCGDNVLNTNLEDCDDGNTTADANGCSGTCRAVNVCGDAVVESAYEDCDDGNTTDEGNGCARNCKTNSACGDFAVQSVFETCDEGGLDTMTCDSDCTTVMCGDDYVNEAANEQCEPPGDAVCSATCQNL